MNDISIHKKHHFFFKFSIQEAEAKLTVELDAQGEIMS